MLHHEFCFTFHNHLQISSLRVEQFTSGSACPKPKTIPHALMIFDRHSPFSWRHCKQYCMDRPVVDPHLIYNTFVHKPSQFVDPSPREHQTLTSNTVVYHFQQLYRDRSLEVMSGGCGDPIILDDRSNCFSNYCFQDLSHIQRFLMEEFNVSALKVQTMSKELAAVQERISAAAASGGLSALDTVLFQFYSYLIMVASLSGLVWMVKRLLKRAWRNMHL